MSFTTSLEECHHDHGQPSYSFHGAGWLQEGFKKIPLQTLLWPVTGGRFQPNFCLERFTRNCTKSGQLGWFLFRFFLSVAVAFAALQGSPSWFPANSALPYPWNQKETLMTTLLRVAIAALILISAGCSSMGGNTSFSGDPSNLAQSSLYRGR